MKLMEEQSADASTEKHVPVIEKIDNGIKVKVGSVPHPMEEKHYIEWIEITVDGKSYKQFLKPGDSPEAFSLYQVKIFLQENFAVYTYSGKVNILYRSVGLTPTSFDKLYLIA